MLIGNVANLEKRAFSLKEIAGMYGVSVNFLRLEIARGRLKPLRLGRCVRVARDSLEQWADGKNGPANRTSLGQ
jgi:excisionase family DNA binding protein